MSLRRKAAATAAFTYLQFGIAIVAGIFLVPLTIHSLGARTWGVWLASGEVLAYAGMTDLGMMAVLPWMIAEAEGRRDRREMAQLVSQGVWLGGLVAVLYTAIALLLWQWLPSALFLSVADRQLVERPLALAVVLVALSYPMGAYRAIITGVQDVRFLGITTLVQGGVSAALTAILLLRGWGLWALVLSTAAPQLATTIVLTVRAAWLAPEVVFHFSRPRLRVIRFLFTNGIGVWLGGLGWQILSASNGIVITYLGHPEWVAVWACTGKLAAMCLPLAWVLPDSGHVGLAQLHGEGVSRTRVRSVILLMQRLHLAISGVVACGLLAFNPAFVTSWVGPQMFAGLGLNALLAAGVVVQSFAHGLATSASIVGDRPRVGALVFANGVVQAPLAIFLGHRFGLEGVAIAGLVAAGATTVPGCAKLLARHDLRASAMFAELAPSWSLRALPLLAAAALAGSFHRTIGVWTSAAAATAMCLAYVWGMRPFYAEGLPLDDQWIAWLRRFHLLPPTTAAPAAAVVGSP